MSILELLLIAIGLSMDAFAAAVCSGLSMPKVTLKKTVIVGLYFGVFQAIMPLIGYLFATRFTEKIISFDHWIAFFLLCYIGGRMIVGSFNNDGGAVGKTEGGTRHDNVDESLRPAKMLPLAIATSIDALAAGVSFAFLRVDIVSSVLFIGITTFIFSAAGVKIGNIFGTKLKSKAEFAGGFILILIGLKILLEHTGILVI